MHTIVFATGNRDKIREIREIIGDRSIRVLSMREAGLETDPEENGQTFEENALIKAQAVYDLLQTQRQAGTCLLPAEDQVTVMSDDSGLCVDALDGAPGVLSARYMGRDTDYRLKMQHIMDLLDGLTGEARSARFVAAVAVILPDGTHRVVRGAMEGQIGHTIAGEHGFGYDPFFFLPQYGRTSAEISPEEKNAISHRGAALRQALAVLDEWEAQTGNLS